MYIFNWTVLSKSPYIYIVHYKASSLSANLEKTKQG